MAFSFREFTEYQQQIETLLQAYKAFDKKQPTPIRKAALAQDEEDLVKEGLIPFLKQVVEGATELLRVPVTISLKHETGKQAQIEIQPRTQMAPIPPKTEPTETPKPSPFSYTPQSASKAPPTGLRVNIGNGNVIHEFYAADTFAQAIAYASDKLGIEKVINVVNRYGLVLDGDPLVKKGHFQSPLANSHEVGMGYYTNTHSNNPTKKRLLETLFNYLGLSCSVTIMEKR